MASVGEIWSDPKYYQDDQGRWRRKYYAVLGMGSGDVTVRLLTSQQHGRPTDHICYQDDSYPAFFLGVIDPASPILNKLSWLDLRYAADIDDRDFAIQARQGDIALVGGVPPALLCSALLCAATATDTRPPQTNRIFAARAVLRCP